MGLRLRVRLAAFAPKLAQIFFAGLRPAPRWGWPPQTPRRLDGRMVVGRAWLELGGAGVWVRVQVWVRIGLRVRVGFEHDRGVRLGHSTALRLRARWWHLTLSPNRSMA